MSVAFLVLSAAPPAMAQSYPHCPGGQVPRYVFGFKALHDVLGETMGEPLECEHANPGNGDALQMTTRGLSFYRASTNTPTFTTGWEHWGLTDEGLVYWTGDSIDPPPEAQPISAPVSVGTSAHVLEVVAADTLRVRLDGVAETVRLIGVETPAVFDPAGDSECYGVEALATTRELALGQTVSVETDPGLRERDQEDRLLAYVWLLDGRNLGELLIRQGAAREYTSGARYRYQDQFVAAQVEARFAGRGLWGACDSPMDSSPSSG